MANMKNYSSGDFFAKKSLSDRIFGAAVILLSILVFYHYRLSSVVCGNCVHQ